MQVLFANKSMHAANNSMHMLFANMSCPYLHACNMIKKDLTPTNPGPPCTLKNMHRLASHKPRGAEGSRMVLNHGL